jgi:toxin CptA
VSSRSERFECRWQASRSLLTAYIGVQCLALIAFFFLNVPVWIKAIGVLLCLWHGVRYLHRVVLQSDERAYTGLRRDPGGWQVWSERSGWQGVQLRRDSVALPLLVILRFRVTSGGWMDRWWVSSVCIPADALPPETHRRLRLRLKFSRRRWAAPE